jgi:hypothetical protein
MVILRILSVSIFVCMSATIASAGCLTYDNQGNFFNNCGYKVIFTFHTIGGGCYEGSHGGGTETVTNGHSVHTGAAFSCNGRRPQRVEYNWCPYDAWVKNSCATH